MQHHKIAKEWEMVWMEYFSAPAFLAACRM